MKALLLVLFGVGAFAQKAEIIRLNSVDKVISARIGEKYEFEIFLKVHKWSSEHANIYSVKGWYWYEKKQIKIPLVGFFDGDLTLFHFKDEKLEHKILNLQSDETDLYSQLEDLKRIPNFDERFSFYWTNGKLSGEWQKDKQQLVVWTPPGEDFEIAKTREFLRIFGKKEQPYDLDLYALKLYKTDFSLVSYFMSKTQNRALLEYEYQSRPYAPGMCGAGMEKGYVTLRFDANLDLVSYEIVETESCLENIYAEEDTTEKSVITVTDSDGKTQKWKVDAKAAQIIQVK